MGKRNKSSRGGRGSGGAGNDRITVFSCRAFVTQNIGAAAGATFPINETTISTRAASSYSDYFGLYRYTRIRFRLLPNVAPTAGVNPVCASILPLDDDLAGTAPTSTAQVVEQPFSTMLTQAATVPSAWVTVPRKALLRQMTKWWKTLGSVTNATVDDLSYQARMYFFCAGAAATASIEFQITLEFTAPTFTALNPRPMLTASSSPDGSTTKQHVEGCQCQACLGNPVSGFVVLNERTSAGATAVVIGQSKK